MRARFVTPLSDGPLSSNRAEQRASEALPLETLQAAVMSALRRDASDLATRWSSQARPVLLFNQTDDQDPEHTADATGLVAALIGGSADGDDVSDDAIRRGMRFGEGAFSRGVSLHHVLKALELLNAMTLYAMESALGQTEVASSTAADGIRLSRQLQRRGALLATAVTRGYMQAYADTLRDRFRHLRHDLRNPLGTIKSVLALMDDESLPLEARVKPSFRAMAMRNTRSLEELIADRLSDAAALLPVVAAQDVSVRTIACGVRRELRGDAERRGVRILVEPDGPHGRLDAAGLELMLRSALQAALQECEPGEQLRVEFEQPPGQ